LTPAGQVGRAIDMLDQRAKGSCLHAFQQADICEGRLQLGRQRLQPPGQRRVGRFACGHAAHEALDVAAEGFCGTLVGQAGQAATNAAMVVQINPPAPAGVRDAGDPVRGPVRSHGPSPDGAADRRREP
jgi:hypothetical protein